MFRSIQLCLLMILGIAIPVQAATVSYGPTGFGPFTAGSFGSFNIPQFDPSLGILTQIDLVLSGTSTGGSNSIENLGVTPGMADLSIGTNITVTGPSSLIVLTTPATTAVGVPLAPFDSLIDYAGPSGFTLFGAASADLDSDTLFAGFAPYLGLGNVVFNYTSAGNTSTNLLNVAPSSSTSSPAEYTFAATVTYTYTPIPEPSTMILMGMGLVGAATSVYRRRKLM